MAGKRVVVVGGGVSGAITVKLLQDSASVTLIDPKEYFEVPYALLRSIVEPDFAKTSLIQHEEYLRNSKLVLGSANTVTDSEVVTTSGEHIPYDYLVIATGSTCKGYTTRSERLQYFQSENKKIRTASTVLIIGGGPVGVELAAEIVIAFPEKEVKIVHSGSRLLEFLGPKASEKTLSWLQRKGVQVILNERIDVETLSGSTSTSYRTSTGRSIAADTHFIAVGGKVASSWILNSTFKDLVDSNGRLKVDQSLRLEGKANAFAVGDIANTKEIKQGYLAAKHAYVVSENIKRMLKDPATNKLQIYKPLASPMGAVSLGPSDGVAQLPFGTIIGWLPGKIKSKHLFVGKTRQALGIKESPTTTNSHSFYVFALLVSLLAIIYYFAF